MKSSCLFNVVIVVIVCFIARMLELRKLEASSDETSYSIVIFIYFAISTIINSPRATLLQPMSAIYEYFRFWTAINCLTFVHIRSVVVRDNHIIILLFNGLQVRWHLLSSSYSPRWIITRMG